MISTILTLIVAFVSLIALMIIHEYGHFIIAKKFGVKVEEFGVGYPPRIWGKKIGETVYSINWLPLGAFVRIYGEEGGVDDLRSFQNLKIWKRVLIVIGGVAAFWAAAIVIFTIVFAMGADLPVGDQDAPGMTNAQVKIISVSQNSPAGQAGVQVGDAVKEMKVSGVTIKINKIAEFQTVTADNKGKAIVLTVERAGKNIDLNITPRLNPPAGEGSVGVGLERMATLIKKTSWYMAPVQGVVYTWQTTVTALVGLYNTFSGLFSSKGLPEGAAFAGPIGITVFLANAASYGAGFFLYFIGTIAVLVAIFNLFPIPALDGGKLVFLLLEKIKGKPVSVQVEQWITMIFFIILITLSLFITVKFDIPRLFDFFKAAFVK
jgi:regulator of sigma E protease